MAESEKGFSERLRHVLWPDENMNQRPEERDLDSKKPQQLSAYAPRSITSGGQRNSFEKIGNRVNRRTRNLNLICKKPNLLFRRFDTILLTSAYKDELPKPISPITWSLKERETNKPVRVCVGLHVYPYCNGICCRFERSRPKTEIF